MEASDKEAPDKEAPDKEAPNKEAFDKEALVVVGLLPDTPFLHSYESLYFIAY